MYTTIDRLFVLHKEPGKDPTNIRAAIGEALGELNERVTASDGVVWSKVSYLEDGDPAPEGWIPEQFIKRDFVPEVDPGIDHGVFAENCLLSSYNTGANIHFLAAWAQFESEIQNLVRKSAGEEKIGPFQFTAEMWDANRISQQYGMNFERSRIYMHEYQCDVAALMLRRYIDAFKHARAEQPPQADQLLMALRIGVPATLQALDLGNAISVADAILASLDDGIDKDAALHRQLELNSDILTRANDLAKPLTIGEVFQAIDERLDRALTATKPLIEAIDEGLLPKPTAPSEGKQGTISLRYSGTAGDQNVYGHLVLRMQEALAQQVAPPVSPDLSFGSSTSNALNSWHTSKGRAGNSRISSQQWSELTGREMPSLKDFCFQITASFEGHGFNEKTNGDEDGAVLTWGYNGFTFKFGHVQEVIRQADGENASWLTSAFGLAKATELRQILTEPLSPNQINWARTNLLNPDKSVKAEWAQGFENFGGIDGVRGVQLRHCEAMWNDMVKLTSRFAFSDRLTMALCYDIFVQDGPGRLSELLKGGTVGVDEAKLRTALAERVSDVSKPRKRIIAAGSGRKGKGGTFYRLDNWGLLADEEDESSQDEAGGADPGPNDDFENYLISNVPEIRDLFSPREFLYKGGNASGHNTDPPKQYWKNILPTARVIAKFRQDLAAGLTVRFNSVYRSPKYNREVGGATNSFHMRFNAIDFRVEGPGRGTPSDWASKMRAMRSAGLFDGGIGLYGSFVHVDTRGRNVNF
ncbi:D-Ala-D-Ala carboxypeptidase family metallohydrolase [Mesorhizobium sp. M0138]|uniref:YcbK family protein n=1 Tax=Mesorhizobium sp. M0138 TaxID=2956891 RepID=UPI00333537FF